MPQGNNVAKNAQAHEAARQLGIADNPDRVRDLHDLVTGKGLQTVKEIVEFARCNGF
jgi:hypothetical protein